MSSDFLEDIDHDANGSTVLLSMKASGDAFLTVMGSENSNDYHLAPNEIGWKNAEKIVAAINAWMVHTKRIDYTLTAPHYTGLVIEKDDCCYLKVDGTDYKLQNWKLSPTTSTYSFYVGKIIEVVGDIKDGVLFVAGISPIIH